MKRTCLAAWWILSAMCFAEPGAPKPEAMVERAMRAAGMTDVATPRPALRVDGYLDPSPNPSGDVIVQFRSDGEGRHASRLVMRTASAPLEAPESIEVGPGSLLSAEPAYVKVASGGGIPRGTFVAEAAIETDGGSWRFSLTGGWEQLEALPPSPLPGNAALVLFHLRERAERDLLQPGAMERFDGVEARALVDAGMGADRRTWYFHPETGVLLGARFASGEAGRPPRLVHFADWKSVSGIAIPGEIRSLGTGHTMLTLRFTHVELNPDLTGAFEPPPSLDPGGAPPPPEGPAPP